ncbi:MAG: PqqD family protein [Bacteroidia bacterium]|nr:PqqD family protein [Bacteroidia bacterium]
MKIKRNIALSDSGFVFNPSTGDSFSTNPIGIEIIKLLKEGKNEDEVKKHLIKTYMTDEVTLEKDYYDFVNMLLKLQLAEGDESEAKN